MDNQKYMCYITYAIALDKMPELPDFVPLPKASSVPEATQSAPLEHPPGFVMQWFQQGGFPEDDID